jgi:hypothetical protein
MEGLCKSVVCEHLFLGVACSFCVRVVGFGGLLSLLCLWVWWRVAVVGTLAGNAL